MNIQNTLRKVQPDLVLSCIKSMADEDTCDDTP